MLNTGAETLLAGTRRTRRLLGPHPSSSLFIGWRYLSDCTPNPGRLRKMWSWGGKGVSQSRRKVQGKSTHLPRRLPAPLADLVCWVHSLFCQERCLWAVDRSSPTQSAAFASEQSLTGWPRQRSASRSQASLGWEGKRDQLLSSATDNPNSRTHLFTHPYSRSHTFTHSLNKSILSTYNVRDTVLPALVRWWHWQRQFCEDLMIVSWISKL